MANDSAGIGDPYWYEWSVGLTYVLEMLDPSSGISGVTLQSAALQGLDDVVVRYASGALLCIQVKHTRADDSLTFGELVVAGPVQKDSKRKASLLRSLAQAWQEARASSNSVQAALHTNRSIGRRRFSRPSSNIARPALSEFWPHLEGELRKKESIPDIEVPEDCIPGWQEWLTQLDDLSSSDQLEFLQSLTIASDCHGLAETETQLLSKIESLLGCSPDQAKDLLPALNHALATWTTTRREREEIQLEDVLHAFKLNAESIGTTHLVAPPEPFFPSREDLVADLIEELRTGASPVVFVTGAPGAGKTSVISSLAARHDRAIDIRFHAYRPVTPDDTRLPPDAEIDLSAEGLWGDLLSQLRDLLHGQLAAYRVPVRNGFLSATQRREHVLRIANSYGTASSRRLTIAIDGIDHAVRAKTPLAESFLASLPPPTEVPENVRILIGGQTPEHWQEYPAWIRQGTAGLTRFDVPPLQESDISLLIADRCPGALGNKATTTRLVLEASGGETLPAIFAVEEARLATSLEDFKGRLEARSLSSNLQGYYDEIWSAVSKRLRALHSFLDDRVALTLAIWDQRIDGNMLSTAFADADLGTTDWRTCLLGLRPLVVEEDGLFRPLHNDVRLFFSSEYNSDRQRFKDHLSSLADYSLGHASRSKYSLGFQLLELSDRASEYPKHFTTDFVLEGWRAGVSVPRLNWHAKQALQRLTENRDWRLAMTVVTAVSTLRQIIECRSWLGYEPKRSAPPDLTTIPALSSECLVTPQNSWTVEIVEAVAEDAIALARSGQMQRARGLFRRWFRSLTPPQILDLVSRDDEGYLPRDYGNNSLERVGEAAEACGLRPPAAKIRHEDLGAWASVFAGYVNNATASGGLLRWCRAFRQLGAYSPTWLEEHLMALAEANRWTEIAIALIQLAHRAQGLPDDCQLRFAVLAMLTEHPAVIATWTEHVEKKPFDRVPPQKYSNERAEAVLHAAFILGSRSLRPIEAIRDDALSAYRGTHSRPEALRQLSFYSLVAAAAGRWLARPHDPSPLSVDNFGDALNRLARFQRGIELYGVQDKIAAWLFRLLAEAATRSDGVLLEHLESFARDFVESGRMGPPIDTIWEQVRGNGGAVLLRKWIEERLSPKGGFWLQKTNRRIEEAEALQQLVAKTPELSDLENRLAELRVETSFGYTDHKEYNLSEPLGWFRELAGHTPQVWQDEGLQLLALSAEADLTGDNRIALVLESGIGAAAARCGPCELARLEAAQWGEARWFESDTRFWVGALAEALELLELSEQDLFSIWSTGMGCLSWQHHHDVGFLRELRCAVEHASRELELDNFVVAIQNVSRLEWAIAADPPETRLHGLWYHDEPERPEEDALCREFEELQLVDAIVLFQQRIVEHPTRRHLRRAATGLGRRIRAEQPEEAGALATRLLRAWLDAREEQAWPWGFDGTNSILEEIAPLLADDEHWRLVDQLVSRLESDASYGTADSICQDLNTLCRKRSSEAAWLRLGLAQHLATQQKWVPKGRELPLPTLPHLPELPSWASYGCWTMLRHLSSDSMLLSHSALRGLAALLQLVPEATDDLCQLATNLEWQDSVAVGQVLEFLAAKEDGLPAARAWLDSLAGSAQLEAELQAWAVQCSLSSSPEPRFELPPSDEEAPSVTWNERVVVEGRTEIRSWYSSTNMQAAVATLHYLAAVGAPATVIESTLATSLRLRPTSESNRENLSRSGDAIYQPGGQRARLLNVVRSMLAGRPMPMSPVRLAQAILLTDEPRVLFGNWPMVECDWPLDYSLDSLISTDRRGLQAKLEKLLTVDLATDEVVAAGLVTAYSRKCEALLHRAPLYRRPGDLVGPRPNTTTLGGRTLFFRDPDRFENTLQDGTRWLWLRARGLARFPSQSLSVVPNAWLQRDRLLVPTTNPLVWETPGGHQVRYERIYGPLREGLLDCGFHVAYLERWVCSAEMLPAIERQLPGSVTIIDELETLPTGMND